MANLRPLPNYKLRKFYFFVMSYHALGSIKRCSLSVLKDYTSSKTHFATFFNIVTIDSKIEIVWKYTYHMKLIENHFTLNIDCYID